MCRLPLEIRILIWEQALSHSREVWTMMLIHGLKHPSEFNMSTLFGITRESRSVALRFYQVQLPCRYYKSRVWKEATLYLCPDLDFLRIDSIQHIRDPGYDGWIHDNPAIAPGKTVVFRPGWMDHAKRVITACKDLPIQTEPYHRTVRPPFWKVGIRKYMSELCWLIMH